MENKQIEVVKEQVNKALEVVTNLSVKTKDEFSHAVEVGTRIKQVTKHITERKEEITKPLNEALKSARALFKPLEDTLEQAESMLKQKMLVYKEEEREKEAEAIKKAQEEAERQQALLNAKEITPMEASQNTVKAQIIADQSKAEKTVKTESGAKATEKFVTEYVVVNKNIIPMVFLEPNMVTIKQAFKDGQPVPGVEERKKAIISF